MLGKCQFSQFGHTENVISASLVISHWLEEPGMTLACFVQTFHSTSQSFLENIRNLLACNRWIWYFIACVQWRSNDELKCSVKRALDPFPSHFLMHIQAFVRRESSCTSYVLLIHTLAILPNHALVHRLHARHGKKVKSIWMKESRTCTTQAHTHKHSARQPHFISELL